jgi:hypothetical protein
MACSFRGFWDFVLKFYSHSDVNSLTRLGTKTPSGHVIDALFEMALGSAPVITTASFLEPGVDPRAQPADSSIPKALQQGGRFAGPLQLDGNLMCVR